MIFRLTPTFLMLAVELVFAPLLIIAVVALIERFQLWKKAGLGLAVRRAAGDLDARVILPQSTCRNCLAGPDELPCIRSRIMAWHEAAI